MASGWTGLAQTLNIQFDTNLDDFAKKFKDKHGPNGNGDAAQGKPAYKFGQFVDKHGGLLNSAAERGRFLIDSGSRHWDGSINILEAVVKHSLTHEKPAGTPKPKKIKFLDILTDPNATHARVEVRDHNGNQINAPNDALIEPAENFVVQITCPSST